jgi:hypothetical protein
MFAALVAGVFGLLPRLGWLNYDAAGRGAPARLYVYWRQILTHGALPGPLVSARRERPGWRG